MQHSIPNRSSFSIPFQTCPSTSLVAEIKLEEASDWPRDKSSEAGGWK